MIIVRKRRGRQGEEGVIHFPGGVRVVFRHAHIGVRPVFAAEVPDDHPAAARLRTRILTHTRYDLYFGPEPVVWDDEVPTTPTSTTASAPTAMHPAGDDALRRGWSLADLEGTGQGFDPTEHGGRSPRTGLTMAEMAMSRPPDGWAEHAATHYPWELPGWRTDLLDWRPPNPPSKRSDNDDEEPRMATSGPASASESVSAAEPDPSAFEPEAPGGASPVVPSAPPAPVAPSPDPSPSPVPSRSPDPLSSTLAPGLTPEERVTYAPHLALIAELWAALDEAPSFHQFGYRQRKAELAKVDTATFHRLIQAAKAERE